MQPMKNELLVPLEREALNLLLAGELPLLQQLREQSEHIVGATRTLTAVGFYLEFTVSEEAAAIPGMPSFAISDVGGRLEGTTRGVGFVLFIRSGRLHFLEGATFGGEEWPTEIGSFSLGYDHGERDWTALHQVVSRANKSSGLEKEDEAGV